MDVADLILEPLRSGIERRALLEVILLGGVCGALSFWVTSFRLSYPAESLAHGLLPGLVLAALAGVPLLVGGAAGVVVAAGLVAVAARDPRIGADSATAVVVTGTFGLGALLALAPDAPPRLEELLFGDPLGVTNADLAAAATLTIVGGAGLAILHRPMCATAFDPAGADALGARPRLVTLALFMLLAAAVAVAVQGLGSLLVLAVLVAPAIAVRRRAQSPAAAILSAAVVGSLSGVVGIYASHHLGSAAGASVALALCVVAALGSRLPARVRRRGARAAAAHRATA
jgi:ABC-type Mn2+/Zn2+ transport system permease subunit